MRQLANAAAANPELRREAAGFDSDGAIDRWVKAHFEYTPEPFEIVMHPLRAVEEIRKYGYFQGDCDDVATLYAAIFKARGTPCEFVAIRTSRSIEGFQHVFTRVLAGGAIFDPTVPPGTRYTYNAVMTERV